MKSLLYACFQCYNNLEVEQDIHYGSSISFKNSECGVQFLLLFQP